MSPPHLDVLGELVRLYDERGAAVTPTELRRTLETDIETIWSCLAFLESNHLVKSVGLGYRPTVTARELLDLDVSVDAVLVLDCDHDG